MSPAVPQSSPSATLGRTTRSRLQPRCRRRPRSASKMYPPPASIRPRLSRHQLPPTERHDPHAERLRTSSPAPPRSFHTEPPATLGTDSAAPFADASDSAMTAITPDRSTPPSANGSSCTIHPAPMPLSIPPARASRRAGGRRTEAACRAYSNAGLVTGVHTLKTLRHAPPRPSRAT